MPAQPLLSAVERAEHEQILQPQADAWAAAHPKLKRPADFDP
jgi:hypothetical protein